MRVLDRRTYQRSHARAPLKTKALYLVQNSLHKASAVNVSESGVLFHSKELVNLNQNIHCLIDIPQYPNFGKLTEEQVLAFNTHDFNRYILPLELSVIRGGQLKDESNLYFWGGQLVNLDKNFQIIIKDYVQNALSNLIFMMKLISQSEDTKQLEFLRKVAMLLDYSIEKKMYLLKQEIELDYQNLKWP